MLDANHSIPTPGVVGRLMGRVNVVRGWRERGIARDTSRDCLRIFRDLEATQPRLRGVARYLEVVVRHAGLEPTAALDVIDGAYESFATWPVERALCLRDVAHYLAARKCLADRPPEQGIVTHLATVVGIEIPEGL